jgi:hypothetical protein
VDPVDPDSDPDPQHCFLLRLLSNLRIKFLVQRKDPEGLTEAYPERPSKEAGEEA